MSGSRDRAERPQPAPSGRRPAAGARDGGAGWILGLQRAVGNAVVTGLVVQRVELTEVETRFLAQAAGRFDTAAVQAAIQAMNDRQAAAWRRSIGSLDGGALDNAYRTLIGAWQSGRLATFIATRELGGRSPQRPQGTSAPSNPSGTQRPGANAQPPVVPARRLPVPPQAATPAPVPAVPARPPRVPVPPQAATPAPVPAARPAASKPAPVVPARPPRSGQSPAAVPVAVPVPAESDRPARPRPPPPRVATPAQAPSLPMPLPPGQWDELPERDRQFLETLWNDLSGLGATFDKQLLADYWRASAAKLGSKWRTRVTQTWPESPPTPQDPAFAEYAASVRDFHWQAKEMQNVWSIMEWIYSRRPSSTQTYQLRVYLNPRPRNAGQVLNAVPLTELGKDAAAKVGTYDVVSRYRDCLVIYLDGKSLAEAKQKAKRVYDWLWTYQRTNSHHFVDEVPPLTKPIKGLVGVGEDPPQQGKSFTGVRQEIVEHALRNAGGDAATFRHLVLAGLAGQGIPAGRPWKQGSAKQKSG